MREVYRNSYSFYVPASFPVSTVQDCARFVATKHLELESNAGLCEEQHYYG